MTTSNNNLKLRSRKRGVKPRQSLTQRVNKMAQYLSHHRGDEKLCAITVTQTPTTAGVVTYLSQIAQGDDGSDRSGYRVNVHRIEFSLSILATLTNNLRVLIVRDTMNQSTTPAVTTILAAATVHSPLAYFNYVGQRRFIPVFDRTYHSSAVGELSHTDKTVIRENVTTHFTDVGATSASAAKNVYFMVVLSDVASASSISTYSRIIFTDE